jgi:hypothetical protein
MRMPHVADRFFHIFSPHRHDPKDTEPSLFDSGIGDWAMTITAVALIVLVLGTVIRWAYLALIH